MNLWGLLKANLIQKKIKTALEKNDQETAKCLIVESIAQFLNQKLTSEQTEMLAMAYPQEKKEELTERLRTAFYRGWYNSSVPSISIALDEVLCEVNKMLKA